MLGLSLHLLSALLLVVLALHVLQLTSEALDLVLVLVDLSLVHVQLRCHRFHLVGLLLEVLLIDRELLGDFGARLASEQVLELDVELFLLLDDHILLDDLLRLLDETSLEGLNLHDHLPGVGIGALDSVPSVHVKRVLELLGERLDLQLLGEELLLERVDFVPKALDAGGLGFHDSKFALKVANLVLEELDVLESLLVLDLTLGES